jgi:aryl-alcohol dehydrogenase-like predicted oxidoreductase
LELGVNHFDNADVYGNFGESERLLAKALGPDSANVVIATKVGHFRGTGVHAYEPENIRHQCETSLRNLKRDTIDIYYFHHGNFGDNDCYLPDAVDVMYRLKEEGKIREIGLSAYSADDFVRLVPTVKPAVLQSWASIGDDGYIREGGPVSNLMVANNIWFVAFSPLKQGLLAGAFDVDNPPDKFKKLNLAPMAEKLDALRERFGSDTADLARVALQYNVSHPNVACSISGFRNSDQVKLNVGGPHTPLTPDDLAFIRSVIPPSFFPDGGLQA